MRYSVDQFKPGEAWLVFSIDYLVQDMSVDIYFLMDIASTYVFGNFVTPNELPDEKEFHKLMRNAYTEKNSWPKILFCPAKEPAAILFRKYSEEKKISFEVAPSSFSRQLIGPYKKSFRQFLNSTFATTGDP